MVKSESDYHLNQISAGSDVGYPVAVHEWCSEINYDVYGLFPFRNRSSVTAPVKIAGTVIFFKIPKMIFIDIIR